jgi:hypothetical protein
MKNFTLILLMLAIMSSSASAQQTIGISFEKSTEKIRKKETAASHPIVLKANAIGMKDSLNDYKISVTVDENNSTLPSSDYSLDFNSVTLDKMPSEYRFFLTLKGDTLPDRNRVLVLNLKLTKEGKQTGVNLANENQTLTITVESAKTINKYNYLGYIGTNFDLIDGVKARDLFFAVNLIAPPKEENNIFGFYLTLYGNRTISTTDTSGLYTYTSRIVGIGGDTARYYTSQALRTVTSVSDNLGATFTPLFDIVKLNKANRSTKLYYAPQFELIWRRSRSTTVYTDIVLVDSLDRANRPIRGTLNTPTSFTTPLNIYDMYLGLGGLFLSHENEFISVRVQGSIGYKFSYRAEYSNPNRTDQSSYTKQENFFSYVRAWVTEPISGLTFGAEVSNNLFKNHYPYYNVTLSKAINLNSLGAIFQPISSR